MIKKIGILLTPIVIVLFLIWFVAYIVFISPANQEQLNKQCEELMNITACEEGALVYMGFCVTYEYVDKDTFNCRSYNAPPIMNEEGWYESHTIIKGFKVQENGEIKDD